MNHTTIVMTPKMAQAFGNWVEAEIEMPAIVRVRDCAIDTEAGKVKEWVETIISDTAIDAIYVTQGDESIFIDGDGNLWDYDDEGKKLVRQEKV